jgi:hypothetical protein
MFGAHHAKVSAERKRTCLGKTQEEAIRALGRACAERDMATPPTRVVNVKVETGWVTQVEPIPATELNTLSNPQSVLDLKALIAADPKVEPRGFVLWEAGVFAHAYEERRKELTGG